MGWLSGGRCYSSARAAAQADCATYPLTAVDVNRVVTWSCVSVSDDNSYLNVVRTDIVGGYLPRTVAVSYPACDDMASYNDTLGMWALGLTACAGVYVVKAFIYRLVTNQ